VLLYTHVYIYLYTCSLLPQSEYSITAFLYDGGRIPKDKLLPNTYTHTHTHVYICVYICIYICIYIHMCVYIHIYICVCIYLHVYVNIYICLHTHIYIYMFIYICIYIFMYIHSLRLQSDFRITAFLYDGGCILNDTLLLNIRIRSRV